MPRKKTGPARMTWKITDVPDSSSGLAQAALDVLSGGEGLFSLAGGWDQDLRSSGGASRIGALVQFLRSEEAIPPIIRAALAEALDPNSGSPVYLQLKNRSKKPRLSTMLAKLEKMPIVLREYEAAMFAGANHADALKRASEEARTNEGDAGHLLADAYANRDRSEQVRVAIQSGKSVTEIAELIRAPLPRKRGPRRRDPDNSGNT